MATKMKMLTLLQEQKAYAKVTNRLPTPRPGVLYLIKLRAHASRNNTPKRRLSISVEVHGSHTDPAPVKINHVTSSSALLQLFVR
jgi:hypothetical protein